MQSGGVVRGGDDGDDNALRVNDEATADISGGTLVGSLGRRAIKVMGNGYATIRGGTIRGNLIAEDVGVIDIHSGTLTRNFNDTVFLVAADESIVNIFGGDFYRESGRPDWHVSYRIEGNDQATVNIHGTDFSTEPWIDDRYRLRGRLADGNELDVITRGNVVLHEIPEPSSVLLLAIGALGLVACSRRH